MVTRIHEQNTVCFLILLSRNYFADLTKQKSSMNLHFVCIKNIELELCGIVESANNECVFLFFMHRVRY